VVLHDRMLALYWCALHENLLREKWRVTVKRRRECREAWMPEARAPI
jgi:hypothetical protein